MGERARGDDISEKFRRGNPLLGVGVGNNRDGPVAVAVPAQLEWRHHPGEGKFVVVNDEAVAREKDELRVLAEGMADEE
jgi:hypothetical protein